MITGRRDSGCIYEVHRSEVPLFDVDESEVPEQKYSCPPAVYSRDVLSRKQRPQKSGGDVLLNITTLFLAPPG